MAWTASTENDFAHLTETVTIPDPGGASESEVYSSSLDYNLPVKDLIFVVLEVTETSGANGSVDAELLGSEDSSLADANWLSLDTSASIAVDTTGTNKGRGFLDAADQRTPYYKIRLFTDGTDILDSTDIKIHLFFKHALMQRQF